MKSDNQRTLGIIVLVIGAALLLKQFGIIFPSWIFSWPMILLALGVVIGVKHGFSNTASLVLLGIGTFFLLRNNDILPFGAEKYMIPVGLIVLGLFLLVKKKEKGVNWEGNYDRFERKLRTGKAGRQQEGDPSDYLNVEAIFCGIKRKSISKSFKGGEITTIFGGTDIDLSHADLEGTAVLDVSVVMGGIKLIVPSHWDVSFGVSNIAAGVEDKRMPNMTLPDGEKKLILTGAVIFGGIEISSY
ncbi:MAG: cell wall-active antibiotics response protein [Lunatimonas sp.]|uniref:LiaF transmembrane domain-containing protein n=1 Tax=Lunatimonas sp. TaxID=2060141 RepID=UPI00263B6E05|nr:DUF5668 domain-containing protein [Lunatimonas sp.]MCC5936955.1 cell wall-active antibiotics response protein [Lunatimonas sp.]